MKLLTSNLLVQFSVTSFIVLATFAVLLSTVLSNRIRSQAQQNLVDEAVLISSGRLLKFLSPSDMESPMTGERYYWFDRFVKDYIVSAKTARIKLRGTDGTVIYSDESAEVGKRFTDNHHLMESLEGAIEAEIEAPDAESGLELQLGTVMEVYAPIVFPGCSQVHGAFEIY